MRIARRRVARRPAVIRSAPHASVIDVVRKDASIIVITSVRTALA